MRLKIGGNSNPIDLMDSYEYAEPGIYHMVIDSCKEDDEGNWFRLGLSVVAGDQAGKKVFHKFTNPALSHKDGGKSCAERLKLLAYACGIIQPEQFFNDQELDIDIDFNDNLIGLQFVAQVQHRSYVSNDKKGVSVELKDKHLWHVDDPITVNIPKDAEVLRTFFGCHITPEFAAKIMALRAAKKKSTQPLDPMAGRQLAMAGTGAGSNGSANDDNVPF